MAGGAVPRADGILLVRADYYKVLYSYGRSISAYSNSDRASRIRLEATSFEEMDCPKCYTYKEQELDSYNYDPYLPRTTSIFYSSFMIEWHVPKKTSWLKIESSLASVKTLARLFHLGFRRRVDEYSSEYMSTRGLHVLV